MPISSFAAVFFIHSFIITLLRAFLDILSYEVLMSHIYCVSVHVVYYICTLYAKKNIFFVPKTNTEKPPVGAILLHGKCMIYTSKYNVKVDQIT